MRDDASSGGRGKEKRRSPPPCLYFYPAGPNASESFLRGLSPVAAACRAEACFVPDSNSAGLFVRGTESCGRLFLSTAHVWRSGAQKQTNRQHRDVAAKGKSEAKGKYHSVLAGLSPPTPHYRPSNQSEHSQAFTFIRGTEIFGVDRRLLGCAASSATRRLHRSAAPGQQASSLSASCRRLLLRRCLL